MSAMPFPIFLDLAGAAVLVVGGGDPAAAKCRLLLGTGAAIRLVAPAPAAELEHLAEAGRISLLRRDFLPEDLEGARLCYIALDDMAAAATVVAEARRRGVLVNAVDRPELCDFSAPAIVDRGPMTIAIGTAGLAPALARNLRARVERAVPPAFGALAALCGRWRARVARMLADREARRRFWDEALEGPEAAAALAGDERTAERMIGARLAAAAAKACLPRRGRASLVGAGPGDAGCLTLDALRAIQQADVILYDSLVGPGVLDLARRDARRIDVGKRCGRHAMSQAAINRLLVEQARSGAHVVRLKGGDPSVFGRGGEEAEALRAAGFAVEIIPGVTAALAAAARLGIPLTHRGVSRALHLLTAHGSDDKLPAHDWAALARAGGTLAIYMGARTLPGLAARLLAAGMPPDTPAVAVENASLPGERRLFGTLAGIGRMVAAAAGDGPTLVLIGEVVALAESVHPALLEQHAA